MRDRARRLAAVVETQRRAAWRAAVLASGTDVTARSTIASCLVLAPHPDDETIGCGATIARKRAAGTPVRVVVAADGRSSHRSAVVDADELARLRGEEVLAACAVLGVAVDDVVHLGFEDETLARREDELAAVVADQLAQFDPEEVLVASRRDWHADHRALNEALRCVLRGRRRRPRVLEYPIWYWIHGPWEADPRGPWAPRRPRSFAAGWFRPAPAHSAELVATAGYLGQKHRALSQHRSQTTNLTGEPGWAVLDETFVASFLLPHEPTFPVADP